MVITPEEATGFYRLIGRALWGIGFFEYQLAHIIVIVFKSPFETTEDAERALKMEFNKTLGNLLNEFRRCCDLTPHLDRRISDFKSERDWLCHQIYSDNHSDFFNRRRFDMLCHRVNRLGDEARDLGNVLERMFDRWAAANGVSQDELQRRVAATVERWRAD